MAENMPSSPTLHRAVYFRTLSCGPGGGSNSGSAKQISHQFSQASSGWDTGASDWKEGHSSLSRSHLRSSRSQRWQKQVRNVHSQLKCVALLCRITSPLTKT